MKTLSIIGPSPTEVIRRARELGFECWPFRAERKPNGPWVHRYRKADCYRTEHG